MSLAGPTGRYDWLGPGEVRVRLGCDWSLAPVSPPHSHTHALVAHRATQNIQPSEQQKNSCQRFLPALALALPVLQNAEILYKNVQDNSGWFRVRRFLQLRHDGAK